MTRIVFGFLLCIGPYSNPREDRRAPREQYDAVLKEFKAAEGAWRKNNSVAVVGTKSDVGSGYLAWPGWEFAPRFVKIAETYPKDHVAVDALLQVISEMRKSFVCTDDRLFLPYFDRALELFTRDHLGDHRVKQACDAVSSVPSPPGERFLRTVLERCFDREVRARACLNLAELLLKTREDALSLSSRDKELAPIQVFIMQRFDSNFQKYIRNADPERLSAEAEMLLERIIKEYGDLSYWQDPQEPDKTWSFADFATLELNDLRRPVGKVAPEIKGEDIQGKVMKLSDYRGKVVMLSFWGEWCGPCMELIPHERSIAKRMDGKPFVLLGVNSDKNRAKAKEVTARDRISWRSWWDGEAPGPIASQWGVRQWPMIYIIDGKGVIRYKWKPGDTHVKLNHEIDRVLGEFSGEGKPAETTIIPPHTASNGVGMRTASATHGDPIVGLWVVCGYPLGIQLERISIVQDSKRVRSAPFCGSSGDVMRNLSPSGAS
jgi:thiol-disulfide isomerase/thioredoxin